MSILHRDAFLNGDRDERKSSSMSIHGDEEFFFLARMKMGSHFLMGNFMLPSLGFGQKDLPYQVSQPWACVKGQPCKYVTHLMEEETLALPIVSLTLPSPSQFWLCPSLTSLPSWISIYPLISGSPAITRHWLGCTMHPFIDLILHPFMFIPNSVLIPIVF
jgi:hypothetical protein